MNIIRTRSATSCYLCGTRGGVLYQGLPDRLFGAPGTWTLKYCLNTECGLIWLDPMPLEDDIWMAYSTYYTHGPSTSTGPGWTKPWMSKLNKATGLERRRRLLQLMHLADEPPGKLLDVGCGNGTRMNMFALLGWEVEGQEVDPISAEYVQETFGYKVHLGHLNAGAFPEASFDAIVMNHVIEHVHDPINLLQECRRLLKRSGKLVVVTPNAAGLGHRYFGVNWRDLDPPRHLYLFASSSLHNVAQRAGLEILNLTTDPAHAQIIAATSFANLCSIAHDPAQRLPLTIRIRALLFQLFELYRHARQPDLGEELVLIATR